MKNEQEQLEALQDIRKMMKESSRFLSLSGLSGVLAGVYALAGAWAGRAAIIEFNEAYLKENANASEAYSSLLSKIILICAIVLSLCLLTAFYFSARKAKRNNHKLFDHTSKKLIANFSVPLLAGGIFCLALMSHGGRSIMMISPVMLIFYGLALVNASKFTLHDIKYLGYLELLLGIFASFFPGHGLLFWAAGFGVLHIVYGSIMWFKYDRAN